MRRSFALIGLVMLIALPLQGCRKAEQPAPKPQTPTKSSTVEVAVGDSVTMENGLTITIPQGWTAKFTTGGSPGVLSQTQYLQLDRSDATTGPTSAMVFTSSADTLPIATYEKLTQVDLKPLREDKDSKVLASSKTYSSGRNLYVVETRVSGSDTGILIFGGEPPSAGDAIQGMWQLFGITGANAPGQ